MSILAMVVVLIGGAVILEAMPESLSVIPCVTTWVLAFGLVAIIGGRLVRCQWRGRIRGYVEEADSAGDE